DEDERVAGRDPDLRVLREQVAVIREPDPAWGREQVVVRERQVRAHRERVAEEGREADDPGAHQEQDHPAAAPGRLAPGPPAVEGRRGRDRGPGLDRRRVTHGTPPPPPFLAWASWLSMSLSSFASPPWRSLIFPAAHFCVKLVISVPYCVPA